MQCLTWSTSSGQNQNPEWNPAVSHWRILSRHILRKCICSAWKNYGFFFQEKRVDNFHIKTHIFFLYLSKNPLSVNGFEMSSSLLLTSAHSRWCTSHFPHGSSPAGLPQVSDFHSAPDKKQDGLRSLAPRPARRASSARGTSEKSRVSTRRGELELFTPVL